MIQTALIGLGAAIASFALFASIQTGSLIAILLFYLAPLPILIAALGFSHWAGLVAAGGAAFGLFATFGGPMALAFLVGAGLPAWWLGHLALLARPAETTTPDGLEWYPVGHLVTWAAILGGGVVVAALIGLGGGPEEFRAGLRETLEQMFKAQDGNSPADINRMLDILVMALPPAAAVLTTITNLVNLWLAWRIVTVSGLLHRPRPDLTGMEFPWYAPVLLGLAFVGTFLPGLSSIAAWALTASLLAAYAFLGLAVTHVLSRRLPSRLMILVAVYASVLIFGWPVLLLTILGLTESAFGLRARFAGHSGPPSPPINPSN